MRIKKGIENLVDFPYLLFCVKYLIINRLLFVGQVAKSGLPSGAILAI